MSYSNFVLAEQNAISTEPPVVLMSKRSKNDLNSVVWLVIVDNELVSLGFLISFNSTEDDSQDGILVIKVLVLWLQIWINIASSHKKNLYILFC